MIDPKLNEIPVKGPRKAGTTTTAENETPVDTEQTGAARPRAGLSINDTIASQANLSVGGRGVDTSGVQAGAGAGAGMSFETPGRGDGSPAPNIVPGVRGSGTTVRGGVDSDQMPTVNLDSETSEAGASSASSEHTTAHRDAIAARAYECWCERGCPEGSPELDWYRAEQDVLETRQPVRVAGASKS